MSTVVAINVLEHIDEDSAALRSLARLVPPGGSIVLWGRATCSSTETLTGGSATFVGYTPRTLREAIVSAGLAAAEVRPVNLLGGIAWWLAVRRGGVGSPRPELLRTYDRVVVPNH